MDEGSFQDRVDPGQIEGFNAQLDQFIKLVSEFGDSSGDTNDTQQDLKSAKQIFLKLAEYLEDSSTSDALDELLEEAVPLARQECNRQVNELSDTKALQLQLACLSLRVEKHISAVDQTAAAPASGNQAYLLETLNGIELPLYNLERKYNVTGGPDYVLDEIAELLRSLRVSIDGTGNEIKSDLRSLKTFLRILAPLIDLLREKPAQTEPSPERKTSPTPHLDQKYLTRPTRPQNA